MTVERIKGFAGEMRWKKISFHEIKGKSAALSVKQG
jgi:hypothetical protein